jgi:hypothetical protein
MPDTDKAIFWETAQHSVPSTAAANRGWSWGLTAVVFLIVK